MEALEIIVGLRASGFRIQSWGAESRFREIVAVQGLHGAGKKDSSIKPKETTTGKRFLGLGLRGVSEMSIEDPSIANPDQDLRAQKNQRAANTEFLDPSTYHGPKFLQGADATPEDGMQKAPATSRVLDFFVVEQNNIHKP